MKRLAQIFAAFARLLNRGPMPSDAFVALPLKNECPYCASVCQTLDRLFMKGLDGGGPEHVMDAALAWWMAMELRHNQMDVISVMDKVAQALKTHGVMVQTMKQPFANGPKGGERAH